MTRRPTVFLDRDGTLNREIGFFADPSRLELLPGVRDAVRRLDAADFRLVVVTNQSGIARGHLGEADLARIHARLHDELDRIPAAYLHCPHLPAAELEADGQPADGHGYGGDCHCRKPGDGLLRQARDLLCADFEGGAVIGDSARDLIMARGTPLRRILVRSGKPVAGERSKLAAAGVTMDHEADDLAAAVDWLLAR